MPDPLWSWLDCDHERLYGIIPGLCTDRIFSGSIKPVAKLAAGLGNELIIDVPAGDGFV